MSGLPPLGVIPGNKSEAFLRFFPPCQRTHPASARPRSRRQQWPSAQCADFGNCRQQEPPAHSEASATGHHGSRRIISLTVATSRQDATMAVIALCSQKKLMVESYAHPLSARPGGAAALKFESAIIRRVIAIKTIKNKLYKSASHRGLLRIMPQI